MYEIFRTTDNELYIANGEELVLKVCNHDLFLAEKVCNLLNAAQQSFAPDVACHWCEMAADPNNHSVTVCPFHKTPRG